MNRPRPHFRNCADCGVPVKLWDHDDLALCPECLVERRRLEQAYQHGDGQAGARCVGRRRGTLDDFGAHLKRPGKQES